MKAPPLNRSAQPAPGSRKSRKGNPSTLRLLQTIREGEQSAKIYKDPPWGEYRVKFFDAAGHIAGADYHTDTRGDAQATAIEMLARGLVRSNPGKRVLLRDVKAAERAYAETLLRFGAHDMGAQRAHYRWHELQRAYAAQTGKRAAPPEPNPLGKGFSKATLSANIARMTAAGFPPAVAAGASYGKARRQFKKRRPGEKLPAHLRPRPAPKVKRKRNPAAPAALLEKAAALYQRFTGERAGKIETVAKPVVPDVVVKIGTVDALSYTTRRDGVTEHYRHDFAPHARPVFAVAPDGSALFLIGGAYKFGARGIVDAKKPRG